MSNNKPVEVDSLNFKLFLTAKFCLKIVKIKTGGPVPEQYRKPPPVLLFHFLPKRTALWQKMQ